MKENICIIGLGYVGLPLATLCARKGYKVAGLEKDSNIINLTNKGILYIDASKDDSVALGPNNKIGLVYHGAKSKNWAKT